MYVIYQFICKHAIYKPTYLSSISKRSSICFWNFYNKNIKFTVENLHEYACIVETIGAPLRSTILAIVLIPLVAASTIANDSYLCSSLDNCLWLMGSTSYTFQGGCSITVWRSSQMTNVEIQIYPLILILDTSVKTFQNSQH